MHRTLFMEVNFDINRMSYLYSNSTVDEAADSCMYQLQSSSTVAMKQIANNSLQFTELGRQHTLRARGEDAGILTCAWQWISTLSRIGGAIIVFSNKNYNLISKSALNVPKTDCIILNFNWRLLLKAALNSLPMSHTAWYKIIQMLVGVWNTIMTVVKTIYYLSNLVCILIHSSKYKWSGVIIKALSLCHEIWQYIS